MKMREELIEKVLQKKVIAIVRGIYGDDCVRLAEALSDGGIELLEVTFDQNEPERLRRTSDTVSALCRQLSGKLRVGAGTVTSLEMLDLAASAGAEFIVSPDTNADVIRATAAAGLVSIPGALSPTEIRLAHDSGADFVKIFPAGSMGAAYIKAVRAPFNNINFLAVGGVNENNMTDFLAAGACGVGVGGNLVNKKWVADGEFEKIIELARAFAVKA